MRFRSKERMSGTRSRHEELVVPTSRFFLKDMHVGNGIGINNGEAVVDRVGWEQAFVDPRESPPGIRGAE